MSWDKRGDSTLTVSVIGYEVQVATGTGGTWTGASTGCARGATKSSTDLTCTVTGLAAGTYSFRVAAVTKNRVTKNTKTADFSPGSPLVSIVVPGAPAIQSVVAGDAKVMVTVAAGPAGSTPASFTVTAVGQTTKTCTATTAPGSCEVTGLTNGTSYTFTATATNVVGTSVTASAASSSVTPLGAPSAPVIGTATATGPTTATVAFTVLASNGNSAPTKSYTANSHPAGGTGTLTQAGSGTITVTGLTAGVAYDYFTVTATNIMGPSAASANSGSPYRVGTYGPGGGVVFYASATGFNILDSPCGGTWNTSANHGGSCHYLEAQRTALTSQAWCDFTGVITGTVEGFEAGYRNTALMSQKCTAGAGVAAWNSTSGALSDWFLASRSELYEAQRGNYYAKVLSGISWTSSQFRSDNEAFVYDLGSSSAGTIESKTKVLGVRPIRAF